MCYKANIWDKISAYLCVAQKPGGELDKPNICDNAKFRSLIKSYLLF